MGYLVLVAWLIQAVAGVWLLTRWLRDGGRGVSVGIAHVALVGASLAAWIVFLVTGAVMWAWISFVVLTVALFVGDSLLIGRQRQRVERVNGLWRDYGAAIAAVFRRRMPALVVFHALFSPVVYFGCLAVCIGATIAG